MPTHAFAPHETSTPHVVVVGGGVSGLAAAERLVRGEASPGPSAVRVTVLEASDRLGGMIQTERVDGYTYEVGADSVLAAKPATRDLCARLGIADRLVGASTKGAYLYRAGTLRPMPAGLSGLMPTRLRPLATSGILSPRGVARVALEPWRRPAGAAAQADESIRSFVVRRMGREAYERLVEPLLTGIYGGDGDQLSIEATFPQLRAVEREHGSLLRGLRARAAKAGPPPTSAFLSLPTGLAELIEQLERTLVMTGRVTVRRNAPVRAIAAPTAHRNLGHGGPPVQIVLDDEVIGADAVILATSARIAGQLLRDLDTELATELGAIAHGSTATVTLAYARADVPHALAGTGYVTPRQDGRPVMACTWLSSKWADRAPADAALFRVFIGGPGRGALVRRDDSELLAIARAELTEVLGVRAAPRLARVARWIDAMPQYALGHLPRVARIRAAAAAHPWLALAGNAYQGVGIPDCIRSGESAADGILAGLARGGTTHPSESIAALGPTAEPVSPAGERIAA